MGEFIVGIALLCQINTGGTKYTSLSDIADKQKECQKQLATCLFEKTENGKPYMFNTILVCVKEQ